MPQIQRRFVGTMTNTAGETLAFPAGLDYNRFSQMDVMFNVKTLTGGGNMTYAVQEEYSDNTGAAVYIQTAATAALTATGGVFLTHDNTGAASSGNPAMGSGIRKQIVSTKGGTVSAVTTDVYVILHE